MFKKFNARCFIVMVFGILIMGLGVCLFNISRLGCGPAASLQIAFGTLISVTCLGPFISFYNRVISIPLCYGKKKADH